MIDSELYKAQKESLINIYEECRRIKNSRVNKHYLEMFKQRIENLKKGKFILLITGELSAGKSTFINALIGEQILPSNMLQSSCVIVEIFKSEKKFVKVKYADGHEETVYEDFTTRKVYEHLQKIAAIQEEYRDIPTTLIDSYLIKGKNPKIKQLENNSNEILKGKKLIIKKYIQEHPLDKIPVEIEVGFPLPFGFDELRLVDSPGVNALGGLQNRTFEYLNNAHAILFVKKIDEPEKKSFRDFFKKIIPDHSREMLFLILTHSGLYTKEEGLCLYKETVRLYPEIVPDQIFYVDSILRLIELDIEKGKTIDQIANESEEKEMVITSLSRKAGENTEKIIKLIGEKSQFEILVGTLISYLSKAPNLLFQNILKELKE